MNGEQVSSSESESDSSDEGESDSSDEETDEANETVIVKKEVNETVVKKEEAEHEKSIEGKFFKFKFTCNIYYLSQHQ